MSLDDLLDLSLGDDRVEVDISMPQNKPEREPRMEMQQYNPFQTHPMQTWDAITMDRMITIKRPKVQSGTIWITEEGFAETLSLMPLNKAEQHMYWKKFKRIQMLANGELNKKIVDSRQERLMMELVSQKSRLDVAEGGNVNERGMWITNRQQVEQTLRQIAPARQKGFVETVVDGLSGRR